MLTSDDEVKSHAVSEKKIFEVLVASVYGIILAQNTTIKLLPYSECQGQYTTLLFVLVREWRIEETFTESQYFRNRS